MNYEKSNGKSIKEAFQIFHESNPSVYVQYIRFAKNWINSLQKNNQTIKISSKQIIGRLRWFFQIEKKIGEYKINDAFTPYYARLFIKDYPQYKDVFEFRELRSTSQEKLFPETTILEKVNPHDYSKVRQHLRKKSKKFTSELPNNYFNETIYSNLNK